MNEEIEKIEKPQNKSKVKGKRGGARPNSGRKKKEVGVCKFKKQLKDYLTKEDVEALIELAKIQATKDTTMLKFLLEQVFGKAPQSLDVTSGGKKIKTFTNEQKYNISKQIIKPEAKKEVDGGGGKPDDSTSVQGEAN